MSNYHNQQIMHNPIPEKEKEYKTDFELGIFTDEKTHVQRIVEGLQNNLLVCGNCQNLIKNGLFAFTRCEVTNWCVSKNTKACSRFKR